MTAEPRSFAVRGAEAAVLRRRLGPTAWAVLEQLIARSHGFTGTCVATATVRSLAVELGVSKDTAARAVGRLRATGLVAVEQARESTGTFATGSYRIDVPSCFVLDDNAPTTDVTATPSRRPSRTASRPSAPAQLSLIDLDPASP